MSTPDISDMLSGLRCPNCGAAAFVVREVDQTLRAGNDTVTVHVRAGECDVCGERIFDPAGQQVLDEAVRRLRDGDRDGLVPAGTAYRFP